MAFTYTPGTTPSDLTKIRYYIQDTDSAAAIYSDEEINMVLAMEGTVGKAVISLIRRIVAKISNEPDMKADWLQIDYRRSADYWWKLLADAKVELGLGWQVSSGGQHAYRPDSLQKESPDYGEE